MSASSPTPPSASDFKVLSQPRQPIIASGRHDRRREVAWEHAFILWQPGIST